MNEIVQNAIGITLHFPAEEAADFAEATMIQFKHEDRKGSRLHCLMLTSLPRPDIANFLNRVTAPHVKIGEEGTWMPGGFLSPKEARLDGAHNLLPPEIPKKLRGWWLAVRSCKITSWHFVNFFSKRFFALFQSAAYS